MGKDENSERTLELFLKIGLEERTAKNTLANYKVTANLLAVIDEAAVADGCDRSIGNLIYTVATKFPANALVHRPTLLKYIVSSKIKTPAQLEAAFSFLTSTSPENFKVVITNLEAGSVMDLDAKKWPDAQIDDSSSFYKVPFTNVVYIEHTDFRIKDSKDYYGLAPGKSVLLRYAFPIKCTEVIYGDDKETVVEIRAEYDPSKKTKPKGVLHWVSTPSDGVDPVEVEVRLFDKLFLSENPGELDDWLGDLNPQSKVVIPSAYAVSSLRNAALGDKFQFERLGYFAVDKDSTSEKLFSTGL